MGATISSARICMPRVMLYPTIQVRCCDPNLALIWYNLRLHFAKVVGFSLLRLLLTSHFNNGLEDSRWYAITLQPFSF